ncbi:MAG TPA: radical SAM protein [Planctomycetota bacterium]|nr:radical SAM protein [Planctomycetota bacterium]HRR82534.1 radical SAM protein [Planctomycetota bacterium]HRT96318.1 radical SAM protein [Planctomycetota bacterium]
MKVLLLSAPYVPEYMRNARCDFVSLSATQWYPILLGYCGAWLEGQGHTVKLVDAPAHYLDHEATRRIVREFRPDLLVLYTGRLSEQNDLDLAEPLVEELGCDAVLVGPFASIDPEATLAKARVIAKLVVGQFEHPVAELAAGRPPAEVRNLVRREGSSIVRNPVRPYLTGEELDAIPFVSRFLARQVDLRRYKTPSELFPFMDILTGRGCCYGHCTYCLWVHTYVCGTNYSVRSIGNVIEELRCIERELPQVRSVMIQDDTFPESRAREFSEAKLAAGIRLPWSCYARGNMGFEVLKLMKRAGCLNLHVGYESGDPEVLQRIRKGVTVERMTQFTDDAKRAGLRIHGDFAVGFPGETPESFEKTIAWAKRLDPYTAQFQLMIPFPGTPYHDMMKAEGWLNARGEPDMPQFSNEQIRAMAKRAYRRFYLTPRYLWKCLCHPYDRVLVRLKTMARAVPAMFWRRW